MKVLSEKELKMLSGGGIGAWTVAIVSALAIITAGAIDGFTRPFKCLLGRR